MSGNASAKRRACQGLALIIGHGEHKSSQFSCWPHFLGPLQKRATFAINKGYGIAYVRFLVHFRRPCPCCIPRFFSLATSAEALIIPPMRAFASMVIMVLFGPQLGLPDYIRASVIVQAAEAQPGERATTHPHPPNSSGDDGSNSDERSKSSPPVELVAAGFAQAKPVWKPLRPMSNPKPLLLICSLAERSFQVNLQARLSDGTGSGFPDVSRPRLKTLAPRIRPNAPPHA